MLHKRTIANAGVSPKSFEDRWEQRDGGLLTSWQRGIEKGKSEPELRDAVIRGELPVLAWKGGGKLIKGGRRIGSLHYLAMWQGLRGDDLHVDDSGGAQLTCALTGMVVTFTGDAAVLAAAAGESE